MAKLAPYGPFRAFSNDGQPLAGGLLYTYEAGTSTPKNTYTDASANTPNENPVVLDANGYANVWLGDGAYKFILKTAAEVTLWSIDQITGDSANAFGADVINQGGNLVVTSAYANYFINATDAITLSLGSAEDLGEGFYFTLKASNGDVLIDPDGAQEIDGAPTKTILSGASVLVICNGVEWFTAFCPSSLDLSAGTLILPTSAAPAQTADGSIVWDSVKKVPTIGDGAGRRTVVTTATELRLLNIQYITATGTYTPTPGTLKIQAAAQAGGGGSGAIGATPNMGAGGGGAGEYRQTGLIDVPSAPVAVTIGAGGAGGVSAGNGINGGDTIITGILTAKGGIGGDGTNTNIPTRGGLAGGPGTGGMGFPGGAGLPGFRDGSNTPMGGNGGNSHMGGGGRGAVGPSSGTPGTGYGGGGGGAAGSSTAYPGVDGSGGIAIFYEYGITG